VDCIQSAAEKDLAEKIYSVQDKNNVTAGVGIELPDLPADKTVLSKYNIKAPYLVYIGRIEEGKGCKELISYFMEFKKNYTHPIQLVMIGKSYMPVKPEADIVYTGFIDDREKLQLLLQSTLLIVPSKFESLSMVLLEAMYYKKPVLVNQQCEVLQQHIISSKGGLSYTGSYDFNTKLCVLLNDHSQLAEMGEHGFEYVHRNYSWQTILHKFNIMIADITTNS
jgi:glycosyltransferase involved in cell wall biosynthesis